MEASGLLECSGFLARECTLLHRSLELEFLRSGLFLKTFSLLYRHLKCRLHILSRFLKQEKVLSVGLEVYSKLQVH